MDLGRAQIAYDNIEPAYKDMSDKVAELAEIYEKNILNAIALKSKYEYKTHMGNERKMCPILQLSDLISIDDSKYFSMLVFELYNKKSHAEIGEKFAEMIGKLIKAVALSAAEDHATSEEMGK